MVVMRIRVSVCPCHAPSNLSYFKCVYFTCYRRIGVMVRFFRCHILQSSRRVSVIILAFTLLFGFIIGSLCSGFADPSFASMMRTAALSRVSIVGLLPVLLLPFLFSAFAVLIGYRWLIYPVIFSKAFLISYLSSVIFASYPDSGPLFAFLFLMADYMTLPVLCRFWFCCFCQPGIKPVDVYGTVLLILGIGLFDCQVVSPFLASLLL